ncbi:MAG TPA: hypothetical protein VF736_10495, partial [Pyrinomonadaceae bacterium]
MKTSPRIRRALLAALAASAVACGGSVAPAAAGQDARPPKKAGARKKAQAAAEAAARETREAIAALREAAEAARSFDDAYEAVMTQAEAADALWPYDEQAARAILRLAWERTTAPGAEDAFKPQDEEREPTALDLLRTAREEVVARAARHDRRLAESLSAENARDLAGRELAERE